MNIQILFQLHNWDGGDRHNPTDYYFLSESLGQQYKKEVDRYAEFYKKTLIICSSLEDYERGTKEKLRQAALEKLTPAERVILGLE